MCGGWYNRNAISVSSPGRCSRASLTASRPVRLVLARPFRNQGLSDHHTIVAERLDLAIKPVSHRPGFKADLQPVVPIRQSPDRAFDRQRTVFDIAKKSDFPLRPLPRSRRRASSWRDQKPQKLRYASRGPPSVHEARLGLPKQPSLLTARKGGLSDQPREHGV
jgi:hypothetical protein